MADEQTSLPASPSVPVSEPAPAAPRPTPPLLWLSALLSYLGGTSVFLFLMEPSPDFLRNALWISIASFLLGGLALGHAAGTSEEHKERRKESFSWLLLAFSGLLLSGLGLYACWFLPAPSRASLLWTGLGLSFWFLCFVLVGRRSWRLLGVSWKILLREKPLSHLLWLGFLGGILFTASMMMIPWERLDTSVSKDEIKFSVEAVLLGIFVLYFGVTIGFVFFRSVILALAFARFSGEERSLGWGIKHVLRQTPTLFWWGIISGTVGVIIHLIDALAHALRNLAEGVAGENPLAAIFALVLSGIAWCFSFLIQVGWMFKTIFLLPIIVVEGKGIREGMKQSEELFHRIWGDEVSNDLGVAVLVFSLLLLGWSLALGWIGGDLVVLSLSIRLSFAAFWTWLCILWGTSLSAVSNTALYFLCLKDQMPRDYQAEGLFAYDPKFGFVPKKTQAPPLS